MAFMNTTLYLQYLILYFRKNISPNTLETVTYFQKNIWRHAKDYISSPIYLKEDELIVIWRTLRDLGEERKLSQNSC